MKVCFYDFIFVISKSFSILILMEQSMIQDLDSMRNSLGYKNTFTTSFRDGGYELKKYIVF
jgi:hypothetical protein